LLGLSFFFFVVGAPAAQRTIMIAVAVAVTITVTVTVTVAITILISVIARIVSVIIVIFVKVAAVVSRAGSANIPSTGRGKVSMDLLDRQVTVLPHTRHQVSRRHGSAIVARGSEARVSVVSSLLAHVAAGILPLIRFIAGHFQQRG
jgi:hypothetical protein